MRAPLRCVFNHYGALQGVIHRYFTSFHFTGEAKFAYACLSIVGTEMHG